MDEKNSRGLTKTIVVDGILHERSARRPYSARLSVDTIKQLKDRAEELGMSASNWVDVVIHHALSNPDLEGKF
tara:strand:- start:316 stop:534 length:219 start_codon:yes stop_codon:yes gene_type:complete